MKRREWKVTACACGSGWWVEITGGPSSHLNGPRESAEAQCKARNEAEASKGVQSCQSI